MCLPAGATTTAAAYAFAASAASVGTCYSLSVPSSSEAPHLGSSIPLPPTGVEINKSATRLSTPWPRAVAVKSIRLREGLGGTSYDVSGLKVLHLVRDPRAVVRSQLELSWQPWGHGYNPNNNITAKAYAGGVSICGTYRIQLDSSKKIEESRYLLVRYEDIATSPELAVELIYYWSGLGPLPPSILEWIDTNTKIVACDRDALLMRYLKTNNIKRGSSFGYAYTLPEYKLSKPDEVMDYLRVDQSTLGTTELGASEEGVASSRTKESVRGLRGRSVGSQIDLSQFECPDNMKEAYNRPQGTKRDSATMVSMWRTLMSKQESQAVWEGCQDSGVMTVLGYDP